jgi:hypothetical protein
MGRPRTPTAVLDAKGAFIKDPQRKRPNEPSTDRPLGKAPEHLSENEQALWDEIRKRLLPGVAKRSDRDAFESLVLLKARERSGLILPAERGQLIALYGRFAMTPSDRSKVFVDAKPKSALSDFLNKSGRATPHTSDQPAPTVPPAIN